MKTEIHFIEGKSATFPETATVKLTDHGVEVMEMDGDETVRVLFPWNRIDKVSQRGVEITSIYTY
jgi:hypothetical protein